MHSVLKLIAESYRVVEIGAGAEKTHLMEVEMNQTGCRK